MKSVLAAIALACVSVVAQAQADEAALKSAVAGGHRLVGNAARDGFRHPLETLSFFGVKPSDTVVELAPGGGWYTEILAPYLRDKGQLIAAGGDPATTRGGARFKAKMDSMELYSKVQLAVLEQPGGRFEYAQPGSADVVLTFRNVHNWMADSEDKVTAVFRSAYTALKPGGVFGVVEHRRPVSQPHDPKAASGYVHEAHVIKLAQSVGFKLAGKSEINANPKDKADYADGVWTLPPVYALGDKDRAKYQAIGESDRMTLKFIKP